MNVMGFVPLLKGTQGGNHMTRTIVVSAVAVALLGSAAMLAQAQQPAPLQPQVASFFIAENPSGTGNLGGLAGADQICQNEAQALGGQAAAHTWHAYLSYRTFHAARSFNCKPDLSVNPAQTFFYLLSNRVSVPIR